MHRRQIDSMILTYFFKCTSCKIIFWHRIPAFFERGVPYRHICNSTVSWNTESCNCQQTNSFIEKLQHSNLPRNKQKLLKDFFKVHIWEFFISQRYYITDWNHSVTIFSTDFKVIKTFRGKVSKEHRKKGLVSLWISTGVNKVLENVQQKNSLRIVFDFEDRIWFFL